MKSTAVSIQFDSISHLWMQTMSRPPMKALLASVKWNRSYPWSLNDPSSSSLLLSSGERAWYVYATTVTPSFVYVAKLSPRFLRSSWRWSPGVRKEGTKEKVLHDGEFSEHFSFVHLDHARVDLVPRFYLQKVRWTGVDHMRGHHIQQIYHRASENAIAVMPS